MSKAEKLQEIIELSWQAQLAIEEGRNENVKPFLEDIRRIAVQLL